MTPAETTAVAGGTAARPGVPIGRILAVMLFGVVVYAAYAVYTGLGALAGSLRTFSWLSFVVACALAFGNYVLRYFKWEFYLARLGVRASIATEANEGTLSKSDSFLTFLSGFVLTVTPGKVGEVFKSLVLAETHGVPVARTAPIVVAERVTDLIGIIVLVTIGSVGFRGGLIWAGVGATLVLALLLLVASRALSMRLIDAVGRLPGRVGKLAPRLREVYESLATLVAARNLVLPTALSIVAWALECLSLWVLLRGFGQSTSVFLSTFFYATSTLAGALVPVPGGLGITEGALQRQMMDLGHVPEATSTCAMILVRFATLWFAVLVGFVALSLLKRRYPTLLSGGPRGA